MSSESIQLNTAKFEAGLDEVKNLASMNHAPETSAWSNSPWA
jgi:hypothetical protein